MPERFGPLALYNAEVARGIVHTDEWKEHMAKLQEAFKQWRDRPEVPFGGSY